MAEKMYWESNGPEHGLFSADGIPICTIRVLPDGKYSYVMYTVPTKILKDLAVTDNSLDSMKTAIRNAVKTWIITQVI